MVMTMKSSFRTQKEQYDIKRVKARTQRTEILYIFFGIHTANVVQGGGGELYPHHEKQTKKSGRNGRK